MTGDPLSGPEPLARGAPAAAPASTAPASTAPASTGPASTGPASTGPASTGPASTGPASTGPASTGPASTGPASTGPAGADACIAPEAGTELILEQAFDGDSLYALRAAVAAHASEAGLSRNRADDVVIAVHELAANAVRHGAGRGQLRAWIAQKVLFCQVTDDGADIGASPGGDTAPGDGESRGAELHSDRGHGLWLVREVADQARLESGPRGTTATISFVLGPSR